ncbi:DedA family protein [Nocardioides sp. URHA0020]|uniref:DedA family protein n=1 Tax=Nocardioides sp. URHA0020 TaxID=1380392 RepID=UPI00049120D3|nr:DedA family protein [Nocardioides sp. URHA0020]
MTDLPGIFGTIAPYIDDYGYVAVAVIIFLGNLTLPAPAEATLVVSAIYTVSGDLSLVPVLVVAWLAAVLGECAAYAIGRYGGRPLAIRLGRRFGVTHDLLDRAEAFYERRGTVTVIVGRFIPLLRRANGLVAGITGLAWRRFLVANAIGAAIWVAVWTTVGRQAGSHIDAVNTVLERVAPLLAVVFVLLVIAYVVRRRRRRTAPAEDR